MDAGTWAKLNEENKEQAKSFLQALLSKQEDEGKKPKQGFRFGALKGKIEVAANFDDQLPEFEEYM